MDTDKLLLELDAIAQRVAKLRAVIAGALPPSNTQAAERVAAKLCTYCGLPIGKNPPNRGAHNACYRKAMRHIERGWTTDPKLVADGLLLPQAKQGRKVAADDPVLVQLKAEAEKTAEELQPSEKSAAPKNEATKKPGRNQKRRQ